MDTRKPLQPNTILTFTNPDGSRASFRIVSELGRGGSSIVYEGTYRNNRDIERPVRIKECYPFKLLISRDVQGNLMPSPADQDAFAQALIKFQESFDLNNHLFEVDGLTNQVTNTIDIYEGYNTCYVVTAYLQGKALSSILEGSNNAIHNQDIAYTNMIQNQDIMYQRTDYSNLAGKTNQLNISNKQGDFLSLKDRISIVKGVAKAIQKIHENGYLYLDTKPENVFLIEGTTELVQLFDFDSLFPFLDIADDSLLGSDTENVHAANKNINRVSFTKGFAALELQQGQINRLGTYTDVYGVGALLFYLLFGRVPRAFDCEVDSEYDYAQVNNQKPCYPDTLYRSLTEFFHKTIASYYRDRYRDMEAVIEKLEEIEHYANPQISFIYSSKVTKHAILVGREEELKALEDWFFHKEEAVFVLSGMGGMGKSSLARELICRNRSRFDSILYTYYDGSIMKLVTDDSQIWLNTINRSKEESEEDYFKRKLNAIRKLVIGTKTLLVVDNYEPSNGAESRYFAELTQVGWKVLVLTRSLSFGQIYPSMVLSSLANVSAFYQLFGKNLGRELLPQEYRLVDGIIEAVGGHTLTLELVAKQIAASFLTIEEAYELIRQKGFAHMTLDKVDYVRDQSRYYGEVVDIIRALFISDSLSMAQKRILKLLSVFAKPGVEAPILKDMLGLPHFDDVHMLLKSGWIEIDGRTISLHPVICEMVRSWAWTYPYQHVVLQVMAWLAGQLEHDSSDNYMDLYSITEDGYYYKSNHTDYHKYSNIQNNTYSSTGNYDKSDKYYSSTADYNNSDEYYSPTGNYNNSDGHYIYDHHIQNRTYNHSVLFALSTRCVSYVSRIEELTATSAFRNLSYETVMGIPRDQEEYILTQAKYMLRCQDFRDAYKRMKLYDQVIDLHLRRSDYAGAAAYLQKAKNEAKYSKDSYIQAEYYSLEADFYDARLEGAYYTDNEAGDLKKLLKALDKAIHAMRRCKSLAGKQKLAKHMLSKSAVLMRSNMRARKEVSHMILEVKELIHLYGREDGELRQEYYMICGWYYTLMDPDEERVWHYTDKAFHIYRKVCNTDIDMIDYVLVPSANMFLELENYQESAYRLLDAIELCEKHPHMIPYLRKKEELVGYLSDVKVYGNNTF